MFTQPLSKKRCCPSESPGTRVSPIPQRTQPTGSVIIPRDSPNWLTPRHILRRMHLTIRKEAVTTEAPRAADAKHHSDEFGELALSTHLLAVISVGSVSLWFILFGSRLTPTGTAPSDGLVVARCESRYKPVGRMKMLDMDMEDRKPEMKDRDGQMIRLRFAGFPFPVCSFRFAIFL
jgi:hypothetical protein